jgi:hypothetical protein
VRRLVLTLVLACGGVAHADHPNGVAQRLARFIFDGCDYLAANFPQPHKPEPHRKLAAHFGRIVKTEPRGIGLEYVLKTNGFEGWDIAYWERGVDLTIPANVAIAMGDLQSLLGSDRAPDVDRAVSRSADGATAEYEEREFHPPGHGLCRVTVHAEADARKGVERRIFSLRFID